MGGGVLVAALEHEVLEGVLVVLLARLVEVVHVELGGAGRTWRTKEV